MKKLLLLLVALLTGVSGAWATESTIALGASSNIKANGTFYDSNDVVVAGSAWCAKVVVGSVTLAGSVSSYSGCIDAKRNATLTISVPSGMTISSYTMGLKLTSSSIAATAGDVTLSNGTIKTVAASSVNTQSTSINFSNLTGDTNSECIIEISDLVITIDGYEGTNYVVSSTFTREINALNGTFYRGSQTLAEANSNYPNRWLSTAKNPEIKLVTSSAKSDETSTSGCNMIINVDDIPFRMHSDTYTLSVPDRYRIKGYFITGYTSGNSYTIAPNSQTSRTISTDSSKPTAIYVDGLSSTSVSFSIAGTASGSTSAEKWITITSFRVAVEDLLPTTTEALDQLANISVYSSAATAAKTTVASLHTLSEIETVVNGVVNINVAFGNCNTTAPVKYLATTGANITGSDFSTDAAWKLTGYNALDGTFKVYNAAHETYISPLPSAIETATTATTDVASAGSYYIVATTAGDAGGAGKVIFKRLDFNNYRDCIHYQTSGSIAVRWGAEAKASQWEAVNVYSLTYNHYKVADAGSPSKEGATLVASSTNYYITGTEIEYADPFEGLTPVTALNDKPSDGAISSDVVVDYYYEQDATLPFTTSTITNGELDNPTWYYMQINGLATYASGDKMKVDGNSTGLNYERWCFVGDALYGVQIFAESKGVVYPLNIATMDNNDNVQLTSTSSNTRWFVSGNSLDNLLFFQKSGETSYYLNQLGDVSGGSTWSWKIGLWSSGNIVELSAASSNMPNEWAIEPINYIQTQDVWTNMGTIGWPSSAARTTLQTAMTTFGTTASYANYSALLSAWNTYKTTTNITTPPAGFYKVYHPLSSDGTKKYVTVSGSVPTATVTVSNESSAIWYYTGERLIAYSNGYQVKGNASGDEEMVVGGIAVAFTKSNVPAYGFGYLNVVPSGQSAWYVSPNKSDYTLNRWSGGSHDGQQFQVEEVTSLPITMHEVSGAYYATIKLPVAVTLPEGLYAYSATASGDVLTLTKVVENGVLAADQPVLLYSKSNVTSLNIASAAGTSAGGNEFEGTIAAKSVTANENYVLGGDASNVGFYKFSGTVMPGFKAYLPASATNNVKSFSFNFEDAETAIRAIESENNGLEIYDMNGRRVQRAQKGLFIVNGKKVMYK